MQISLNDWIKFTDTLSRLSNEAADKMKEYVRKSGGYANMDTMDVIRYATALAQKYGEGAASLSAMMYDAVAELSGKILPEAEVAEPVSFGEMAKAIQGAAKFSENEDYLSNIVGRFVKRSGADTTLKNAIRDGAEFAWIPRGDTCPFCLVLASRGWQKISKKALKNGHAEHIHSHCDCTYAVRFDGNTDYAGYDPDQYLEMYENAEGGSPDEKINAMRRMRYAQNKDVINAQKREAYRKRHRTTLNTYEDPMREVLGSAEESHPEEFRKILSNLEQNGVTILRREHAMGYEPNPTPGKPGQILMEPNASISAWMHENQHFEDDKASGYQGFRLFMNSEIASSMEQKAYDLEIEFAESLGYNEIADRLRKLKDLRLKDFK